MKSSWFGFSQQ